MHPQLTYLLARDQIREQMARAERDRLGVLTVDSESDEGRKLGRIIPLRGFGRSRMSPRAPAEMADQR
ncbi:MAG: hypothetical protein WCD11_12865 [Solirubrobacteraceae bacterium]